MKPEPVVSGICTTHGSWGPAGEQTTAVGLAAPSFEFLRHPVRLTGPEKTTAVTRVRWLEGELFDTDGHVRRRVTREHARAIVDELNGLRALLGWLEIDLEGRWRWP